MNSLSRAINIPSSLLFSRIVRMKEKKGKEKVMCYYTVKGKKSSCVGAMFDSGKN
jgi:hypothetical protein